MKAILGLHIIAGSLSLILFWLPIFLKKGGKAHRQFGKVYMVLMWAVVITSVILSIENLLEGAYVLAAFLGFIALITANPLWYGIAALRQKRGTSQRYLKTHLAFNWTLLLFGVLLVIYGMQVSGMGVLLIIFGVLGALNGGRGLRDYRLKKLNKIDSYDLHVSGMIVSGIAAYTAFAAFGGRQFFSDILIGYWMILPWIMPTVIGVAIINYMRHKRRLSLTD